MKCPRCQHPNREEAAFCAACGTGFARVCGACGAVQQPGAKFCDVCGKPVAGGVARTPRSYTPQHLVDRILASRVALEGERKQVTVLFADVKGSMELAAQVDPEAWHRIMDRFFTILAEGVHRFEGTVNQFTGDGIMALFGAPVAHEDHARRACSAALHLADTLRRYADELRRSAGLNFSVRMGLNSGEVVIGKIGDDLRMECTAHGQTVGLAARIEQLAEAGRIYVSEPTARLVAGMFGLRELGAFTVKGVSDALRVYELERVGPLRTPLEMSRARGFSRFVGREEEHATLEAALTRALSGNGQVVGLVADSGVGKSRLCHEFSERCRARGIPVHAAHAVAHGKMVPLVPALEYLRGYFGITGSDSPQTAREKIAGRVLLLEPELVDAVPLIFDLLGVPDAENPLAPGEPEDRQRQLLSTLRRLVHAQSRREPGVSLIEDLHWLDEASEAFVANFVEAVGGTRTLLLVNFRPGYRAAWMQRSFYQQLPLLPLGPEAIAEMLHELLGGDPSLLPVRQSIQERAAGNPFFVEEIVRALAEAGDLAGAKGEYCLAGTGFAPALPATIQAALGARIDRLGEREKHVLQMAAVIGKEFAEGVLRHMAALPEAELAAALRALVGAEFLHATPLRPEADYAFAHPLTQEVAYHSQLGDGRSRLHAGVATALQELHAERLGEHAALIAHHWEAAGMRFEAARWRRRAALKVASIRVGGSRWRRDG